MAVVQQGCLDEPQPGHPWRRDEMMDATVATCLGQRLTGLAASQTWVRGVPSPKDDGDLELTFDRGGLLKLTATCTNGVTAYPYHLSLQRLDDGLEWRRRDLSNELPWRGLIGAVFTAVDALVVEITDDDFWRRPVRGLRLRFGAAGAIGFENLLDYDVCRYSFDPAGGVWDRGRLAEWVRWSAEPSAAADRGGI